MTSSPVAGARAVATSTPSTSYKGGCMYISATGLVGEDVDVYRNTPPPFNSVHSRFLIRGGYRVKVGASGTIRVIDPEVPFNKDFIYEIIQYPNGRDAPDRIVTITLSSRVPSYPDAATGVCSPVYLCDPLYPATGDWFGLLGIEALEYPARSQLFDVLARPSPVAVSQVRSTARTSIRLMTETLSKRRSLLTMMSSGRILLYRNPDPSYPETDWYISVGSLSEERIATDHRVPNRRWNIEVAVVDRPVGKLALDYQANRTYETFRELEPDGLTPINPPQYGGSETGDEGTYTDYMDYIHVLLGGGLENPSYKNARYPSTGIARPTGWVRLP